MNLYPAITFSMGDWDYYVVRMTASELADGVKFAHEIYEDRTLDEAIQRSLNEGRVKREIVTYLSRQPARFFSSIVIAAQDGDPKFYPVQVTDEERFAIFRDDERLNSAFGVLSFDGRQKYYALDGQHRLAAIRALLDKQDPLSEKAPPDFATDELSVIIVVPRVDESPESFLQRYRRLFSNLNRYAKPTNKATNIIMDEDDVFAIITRRLISEHDFFRWSGRDRDSQRIKTHGGKSLRAGDSYFTSLVTLYDVNIRLLQARYREAEGWGSGERSGESLKILKRFRPDETYIDTLAEELRLYWDGLLAEIEDLHNDPVNMRVHDVENQEGGQSDNLLFWPIGQELLATIARDMLDLRESAEQRTPTVESVRRSLRGLGEIDWRLHGAPWRYLLLTYDPGDDRWRMRSEDRKEATRIGLRILRWIVGLDELSEREAKKLRIDWEARLIPAQESETTAKLWSEVEDQKARVLSSIA